MINYINRIPRIIIILQLAPVRELVGVALAEWADGEAEFGGSSLWAR